MPSDFTYKVEESFFIEHPVLRQFFDDAEPLSSTAAVLNDGYGQVRLNAEGEQCGYEVIGPLVVAVILNKPLHFSLLLKVFTSKYETASPANKTELKEIFVDALNGSCSSQNPGFIAIIKQSRAHTLIMSGRSPLMSPFWEPPVTPSSDVRTRSLRL